MYLRFQIKNLYSNHKSYSRIANHAYQIIHHAFWILAIMSFISVGMNFIVHLIL